MLQSIVWKYNSFMKILWNWEKSTLFWKWHQMFVQMLFGSVMEVVQSVLNTFVETKDNSPFVTGNKKLSFRPLHFCIVLVVYKSCVSRRVRKYYSSNWLLTPNKTSNSFNCFVRSWPIVQILINHLGKCNVRGCKMNSWLWQRMCLEKVQLLL